MGILLDLHQPFGRVPLVAALFSLTVWGCASSDDLLRLGARRRLIEQMRASEGEMVNSTVHTRYIEAGQGESVLLIHGHGSSSMSWVRIFQSLASHYRVIAPDVVGYGESDKPEGDYDLSFFSIWLEQTVDGLGLKQFHLVGHSQGGAIALNYALEMPDHVASLVLIAPAGLSPRLERGISGLPAAWRTTFPSRRNYISRISQMVCDPSTFPEDLLTYELETARMPGASRPFWEGRERAVDPIDASKLATLKVPLLLILGATDRSFAYAMAHRQLAAMGLAPQIIILPKVGHLPHVEAPEETAGAILQFLNQHSNRAMGSQ